MGLAVDCLDAEIACAIERRFEGKIRSAKTLQEEREGVLRFLNDEHVWIKKGQRLDIQINMILSPFDTASSIQRIIDFFRSILQIQKERKYLHIDFVVFGLIPYPSTHIFRRYAEYIDFRELSLYQDQNILTYHTEIWKFPTEMYGILFIKHLQIALETAMDIGRKRISQTIKNHLLVESMSMTLQYLQGIVEFEDMNLQDMGLGCEKDLSRICKTLIPTE